MADHKKSTESSSKPVFKELNADEEPEITEMESLCLQCRKNGITKLLLTKIPFYKEVVIMSFACSHCLWENNELQPASKIQEKGILYRLQVQSSRDLARMVVKTEWACILIPEIDFEIPPKSQEGTVTAVEGIIERAHSGISSKLSSIKEQDPQSGSKIEEFLNKLNEFRVGNHPFIFVLRDVTGNSFVENICVPLSDPQLEVSYFERSHEENLLLGIYSSDAVNEEESQDNEPQSSLKDEVLGIPTNCHACNAPCMTNMKLMEIPHFKDIVIMATNCDVCGHKTNEVKSGSGIEPLGVKFILKLESVQDLKRDLLKSDTCSVSVEELELEMGPYCIGGRYTTVEGILTTINEQLKEDNPLFVGDSTDPMLKENLKEFFRKIDEIISGDRKATLILDDPCGNSYVQSIDFPHPEANLTVQKYERSRQQNEELGLLDMKVENYYDESQKNVNHSVL